ncbi:hypothetical protein J6590_057831 [Homalodisca vitripennis]|nr:hypothetical protein J6590_057831 [Homalodisca vitripennis]
MPLIEDTTPGYVAVQRGDLGGFATTVYKREAIYQCRQDNILIWHNRDLLIKQLEIAYI